MASSALHVGKALLTQLPRASFERLRAAQDYRSLRDGARVTGIVNVFLGALTLWLGLNGIERTGGGIHIIQAALGAFLMLVSLWAALMPSLAVIAVFRWVLAVFGAYNLLVVALALANNLFDNSAIALIVLAVFQLKWARDYHRAYQRHRDETSSTPYADVEGLRSIARLAVKEVNYLNDDAVIDFKWNNQKWKAWLLGDYAYMTTDNRSDRYLFTSRERFEITPRNADKINDPRFDVRLRVDDKTYRGSISKQAHQRYMLWKNAPTITSTDDQLTS